jgi:hypothetical protein
MKFAVVFFAYRRPELLEKSVQSFLNAESSENWKRVLVWQSGHKSMENKVGELENHFDIVVRCDGSQETVLSRINFNRIAGMQLAFDSLESDFVLGIEEDSLISYDSLTFIQEVFVRFQKKRGFRGVNLGSIESKDSYSVEGYSKLRYGLQGQAGGLSKSVWKKCFKILRKSEKSLTGWDSLIEYYLKTGYMVTPNLSRMLDEGWNDGAHAPQDPNHEHYKNLRSGWLGLSKCDPITYRELNVRHKWREDIRVYSRLGFIYPLLQRYTYLRKTGVLVKSTSRKVFSKLHSLPIQRRNTKNKTQN